MVEIELTNLRNQQYASHNIFARKIRFLLAWDIYIIDDKVIMSVCDVFLLSYS